LVDVECPFSFGRDYVTLKRHRLSAVSVSRGMAVVFYSKNNKIKDGDLNKWNEGLLEEKKRKMKEKQRGR
jgi:hypothetical protein